MAVSARSAVGWRIGLGLATVLALVYAYSVHKLLPSGAAGSLPSATIGVSTAAATNVPNAAVVAIADQLGGLQGRSPELVVTPSATGTGYDVSATVDLGDSANTSSATWRPEVKHDVPVYFQGVFASGQPVEQAQVYFTVGGQIVAGAALGKASYQALTASAATGGGWLSTLSSLPAITGEGVNDRWFEIASTTAG
ncbi:hypothetical protein [Alicyclobacillus sp. ALC3]|uniref:hypothetical protein n=1 Tax=Alicyclobacillus sp. ALC3 TaxID=2796143 RepID=UPI0023795832|nr:hypothetical protein [Alicyclobacillus sp. ALC3]WDL97327.1 hypothetical protein JC200_00835 [Alicyclobacillus sp. ALC3]